MVEGDRVKVTVHSLGAVDAPRSKVVLRDVAGKVLATAAVPALSSVRPGGRRPHQGGRGHTGRVRRRAGCIIAYATVRHIWKRVPLPADGSICLPWELR